ncbi:MAG: BspA family leucine-rich repeat surface protein [Actinomycetaceae bacterium]|nr:BspA family leucine-rich repeat surface protein [Actinomycetaceae bacterium]
MYTLYDDGTLAFEDGITIVDPGSFPGPKDKVVRVKGKNVVLKGSMDEMFHAMGNLVNISDLATWDTSNVTDMRAMFSWATSLSDISALKDWKTGNVWNMSIMFNTAKSLKDVSALSGWDTSNVRLMTNMFLDCSSLMSVDVSGWDMMSVVSDYRVSFDYSPQLTSLTVGENARLNNDNYLGLHEDLIGRTWYNVTKGAFATGDEMVALTNEGNGAGTWLLVTDAIDAASSSIPKPDGYVTVEFAAGEHGKSMEGSSKFYVNASKEVTLTAPTVTPEAYYVNTGWDSSLTGVFTSDKTITMGQKWIDQVDTPDEHTKFLEVTGAVVVGNEVTLDEPSEVKGFTDRRLVKAPANGETRLASVHYTAKQVGADSFDVAYWMGALSGSPDYIVTYKVEVTAKASASAVTTRPLSSTGSEVGSPIALALLLFGLGALLARRSKTMKR